MFTKRVARNLDESIDTCLQLLFPFYLPKSLCLLFSFWHLAEDCQLTTEIKSLCGINLLLFVSFGHLPGCSSVDQECV